jgi:phage FluMu protein Com
MYERFGKSFKDILDLKTAFFEDNDKFLERALKYAKVYTDQPARVRCKLCDTALPAEASFVKHAVPYVICPKCTHLNGMHEDTDVFCQSVYTQDGGREYAENYTAADADTYRRRRERIYLPKAQFFAEVMRHTSVDPSALRYVDMGAGAGYFVSAMTEIGLNNIAGFEVSKAQVDLGNWAMGRQLLSLIDLDDTERLCREYAADVATFIGVFEHLQRPREVLAGIRANAHVKYVYICVPMLGPCIFGEMAFPSIMPRQLAVGHTHLFTDESLRQLESEFGLERIGAWWFGTDMTDYYRSIMVTLQQDPDCENMTAQWAELFADLVDETQLAIDRQRKSGQVHVVFKVRR